MAINIGRREFIGALGSAVGGWSLAARARQPAMPVIGYLSSVSPGPFAPNLAAFRRGLGQTGFARGPDISQSSLSIDSGCLPRVIGLTASAAAVDPSAPSAPGRGSAAKTL